MNETIRERLKRHMRRANMIGIAIVFFGFGLPPLLPIEAEVRDLVMAIASVALLLGWAFVSRFPCPICGRNVGGMFGNRASGLTPSGRGEKPANSCPHCGVSLDRRVI
jgi:hypothetical protein